MGNLGGTIVLNGDGVPGIRNRLGNKSYKKVSSLHKLKMNNNEVATVTSCRRRADLKKIPSV